MSDGMSDSRRDERATRELEEAATILCEALLCVRDDVFGYPAGALSVVNSMLVEAGVFVTLVAGS